MIDQPLQNNLILNQPKRDGMNRVQPMTDNQQQIPQRQPLPQNGPRRNLPQQQERNQMDPQQEAAQRAYVLEGIKGIKAAISQYSTPYLQDILKDSEALNQLYDNLLADYISQESFDAAQAQFSPTNMSDYIAKQLQTREQQGKRRLETVQAQPQQVQQGKQVKQDFKSKGIRGARQALKAAGFNLQDNNYGNRQNNKSILKFLTSNFVRRSKQTTPRFSQVLKKNLKKQQNWAWQMIPGATWDVNTKTWVPPPNMGLDRPLMKQTTKARIKQQVSTTVNPHSLGGQIGPIFQYLGKFAKGINTQGFGPISKNSLPIYLGRFVDPKTNRLRTLAKPAMITNPLSYTQAHAHACAQAIYKWNQFARAAQKVVKLNQAYPQQWKQQQQRKYYRRLDFQTQAKLQMRRIAKQIITGQFLPYNQASAQQKVQMRSAIKNRDYQQLRQAIKSWATIKMRARNLPQWRFNLYKKFLDIKQNIAFTGAKAKYRTTLERPLVQPVKGFRDQIMRQPYFITQMETRIQIPEDLFRGKMSRGQFKQKTPLSQVQDFLRRREHGTPSIITKPLQQQANQQPGGVIRNYIQ